MLKYSPLYLGKREFLLVLFLLSKRGGKDKGVGNTSYVKEMYFIVNYELVCNV